MLSKQGKKGMAPLPFHAISYIPVSSSSPLSVLPKYIPADSVAVAIPMALLSAETLLLPQPLCSLTSLLLLLLRELEEATVSQTPRCGETRGSFFTPSSPSLKPQERGSMERKSCRVSGEPEDGGHPKHSRLGGR